METTISKFQQLFAQHSPARKFFIRWIAIFIRNIHNIHDTTASTIHHIITALPPQVDSLNKASKQLHKPSLKSILTSKCYMPLLPQIKPHRASHATSHERYSTTDWWETKSAFHSCGHRRWLRFPGRENNHKRNIMTEDIKPLTYHKWSLEKTLTSSV